MDYIEQRYIKNYAAGLIMHFGESAWAHPVSCQLLEWSPVLVIGMIKFGFIFI